MATSGHGYFCQNLLRPCKYFSSLFLLPCFSPLLPSCFLLPLLLPSSPSLSFPLASSFLPAALSALISDIEGYWSSVAELEAWLGAGEAKMEECGPIGANLPRLVEQSPILEVGTTVDRLPMVTPSHHQPSVLQYHTITQSQHHSCTITVTASHITPFQPTHVR